MIEDALKKCTYILEETDHGDWLLPWQFNFIQDFVDYSSVQKLSLLDKLYEKIQDQTWRNYLSREDLEKDIASFPPLEIIKNKSLTFQLSVGRAHYINCSDPTSKSIPTFWVLENLRTADFQKNFEITLPHPHPKEFINKRIPGIFIDENGAFFRLSRDLSNNCIKYNSLESDNFHEFCVVIESLDYLRLPSGVRFFVLTWII
jgi:hypothetical protein